MNAGRAAALTLGDRRREVSAVLRSIELHGGAYSATDRLPTTWYATVEVTSGLRWSSVECRSPQAALRELADALEQLGADEADL